MRGICTCAPLWFHDFDLQSWYTWILANSVSTPSFPMVVYLILNQSSVKLKRSIDERHTHLCSSSFSQFQSVELIYLDIGSALRSSFLAFLMFLKPSKNCQSCAIKVGHQNNKFFSPKTRKKLDLSKEKLFPDPHFMGQLFQSSNSLQKHQKHQKTRP
jgi:hypothetical protein